MSQQLMKEMFSEMVEKKDVSRVARHYHPG